MATPTNKAGLPYITEEPLDPKEYGSEPSPMYNVPNPKSDVVAGGVEPATLDEALLQHAASNSKQLQSLPETVRDSILSVCGK